MVEEQKNPAVNMEEKMKQDSLNRDRIMEEVIQNLDVHSRKIFEYNKKAKTLDVLSVKYNKLVHESKETITTLQKKVEQLTEEKNNLENEVMALRRTVISMKGKVTGMRSALELVIGDFGIEQVVLATGIDKDKLKEYLSK